MKKYEAQNIRRRFNCDPKAYANLLVIQDNSCAMCGDPATKSRKLIPDGRIEFPTGGNLVCRSCAHVSKVFRERPEKITSYLRGLAEEIPMDGEPYAATLYRGQNTVKSTFPRQT